MSTDQTQDLDDVFAVFGSGETPNNHLTPEDEFYEKLTFTHGGKQINKLGNLRYQLNSWELPRFQFMREKGVYLQTEHLVETKPIAGTVSQRAQTSKVKKDLTQAEFIKLCIEYYLMAHHLPNFIVDTYAPHRQVCSMSKVVDMLSEHPDIKELREKKY